MAAERHRVGARAGRDPCGHGRDERGVDPAAQEDAHRHVGDETQTDGVEQQTLELLEQGPLVGRRPELRLRERPVGPRLQSAGRDVVEGSVARGQLAHAGEEAELAGDVAVGEVVVESLEVEPAGHRGVGQQGLQLGGERQAALREPVEEGLLAGAVPREEDAAARTVDESEGEHAVEPGDAVGPPLPVRSQQHLGVACRPEGVPSRLQVRPDLAVVVDLAVEDDDSLAGSVLHRLVAAGREVDDREAPVPEADPAVGRPPQPGVVRAAVAHRVAHAGEGVPVRPRGGRGDAHDPAHGSGPPCRGCRGLPERLAVDRVPLPGDPGDRE